MCTLFLLFDSVLDPVDPVPDPVDPVLEPIEPVGPIEPVFEPVSACRPSGLISCDACQG